MLMLAALALAFCGGFFAAVLVVSCLRVARDPYVHAHGDIPWIPPEVRRPVSSAPPALLREAMREGRP